MMTGDYSRLEEAIEDIQHRVAQLEKRPTTLTGADRNEANMRIAAARAALTRIHDDNLLSDTQLIDFAIRLLEAAKGFLA